MFSSQQNVDANQLYSRATQLITDIHAEDAPVVSFFKSVGTTLFGHRQDFQPKKWTVEAVNEILRSLTECLMHGVPADKILELLSIRNKDGLSLGDQIACYLSRKESLRYIGLLNLCVENVSLSPAVMFNFLKDHRDFGFYLALGGNCFDGYRPDYQEVRERAGVPVVAYFRLLHACLNKGGITHEALMAFLNSEGRVNWNLGTVIKLTLPENVWGCYEKFILDCHDQKLIDEGEKHFFLQKSYLRSHEVELIIHKSDFNAVELLQALRTIKPSASELKLIQTIPYMNRFYAYKCALTNSPATHTPQPASVPNAELQPVYIAPKVTNDNVEQLRRRPNKF